MGWTPTGGGRARGAADTAASPPAPRRRRRPVPDTETPELDKAAAKSPRQATGMKPPVGVGDGELDDRVRKSYRLGKRWSEIVFAVKSGEYSWAEFCEGLDEEELARGQLKAQDGSFKGRPPSLVPREFLLACQREHKRRFEELFQSDVINVAKQYLKLAQDESVKVETRAKMLQYAMERVFGGIPKELKVSQEAPWEQMVVNVFSDDDQAKEMPEHLARRYAGYQERLGGATE
jgi:hypothetical protein